MRRQLLAAIICLAATPGFADAPKDLGRRATETYIRPAADQFAAAAAATQGALEHLCQAPDEQRFDVARRRIGSLVDAWFRVFFLRFGPLVEDNRFERIFFWPDPRGLIIRQVEQILREGEASAIDPTQLAAKSVAVQGLPALEFALFGTGAESIMSGSADGRYRCSYALAVSTAIANTAAEFAEAWSSAGAYARDITAPGPENAIYRSQEEVAAEFLKALAGGTEFLADVVVAPFLGKEPEQANAKKAPLWRSGCTIRAIKSGVQGMRDFYAATAFGGALPGADRWIDGSLHLEMRKVIETLEKIDMPLDKVVAPGPGREALVYAVIALKSLRNTVSGPLSEAIGVSVGFNALDGD